MGHATTSRRLRTVDHTGAAWRDCDLDVSPEWSRGGGERTDPSARRYPVGVNNGGMIAAAVLVALVLLAGFSRETGLPGAVALAVVSALWLLVNKSMEGRVLLVLTARHGVTAADLAALCGFAVAAWRGYATLRSRAAR